MIDDRTGWTARAETGTSSEKREPVNDKIIRNGMLGGSAGRPSTMQQEALSGVSRPAEHALQNPNVCIALLNWNGWQDTVGCLASLQKIDFKEYCIVVIDNGSTDDSVLRIREQFSKIEIIQLQQNLGFAGGCNVGIRHAFALGVQYVWLLNNDTRVSPGALRDMVKMAETDPSIGAVGSVIYNMSGPPHGIQAWGGGRVNLWFGRSSHYTEEIPGDKLDYLTGASMLLRREALEDIGLLDEGFFMYWEDADLCFRLKRAGWKLAVARESQIWHKESASLGRTSAAFDFHVWNSMVRFCARHSPLSVVPASIGTIRMISKRVLCMEWTRAMRLCQEVIAPKHNKASARRISHRD
jgi:GT2 family glycosyltransferase